MAPTQEETRIAKAVMMFMGQAVEQSCSRYDKEIAESLELKNLLFHLSDRAPSAMDKLLKLAFQRCEQALRTEAEARKAKRKAASPNSEEEETKRRKTAQSTEQESASSRPTVDSDIIAKRGYNAYQLREDTESILTEHESELKQFESTDEEDIADRGRVDLTSHPVSPNGFCKTDTFPSSEKDDSQSSEMNLPQQEISHNRRQHQGESLEKDDDEIQALNSETSSSKSLVAGLDGGSGRNSLTPQTPQTLVSSQIHSPSSGSDLENEIASEADRSVLGSPEGKLLPRFTGSQMESGLTMKTPAIEAFVRAECIKLKLLGFRQHFNVQEEIDEILKTVRHLEFYTTRSTLVEYLEDREKMPGQKIQARPSWKMSSLGDILDALQTVKTNTVDNKIHRAYGQKLLFTSVNRKVDKGYKPSLNGRLFNQTAILEELALKKAGAVSKREKDKMISAYLSEYHAGRKWSAVFDSFGGSGIVLVFVTAGIGSHYVEKGWTEFQRESLYYIADFLSSIKGLVTALGSDALELYCQNGCLGTACIERVKSTRFVEDPECAEESTEDEDADGDSDDDGDGDED